jgi:N-acyl-D-amino-acid deacylase
MSQVKKALGDTYRVVAIALLAAPIAAAAQSVLISGARVLDGTGRPAVIQDVRIIGDRIADIGQLHQRQGETIVYAYGLVLAPGFIDTHSHADDQIFEHRDALADVSQGVTTVIVGQDGGSVFPLAGFFAKLQATPAAVNIASYVGHGTLRDKVLGTDFRRVSSPAEVQKMAELLDTEMKAGALGLSSGLEYDPGIYSDSTELFTLGKGLDRINGRYISHVRSEDRYFWAAINEIIAIGRHDFIPVQVSHTKLAMKAIWGMHDSLLSMLNHARDAGINITADVYPYAYWQSTLTVLFPARDFDNRNSAAFALEQVSPADGLLLTHYGPNRSYDGKTLQQIAKLRHEDDTTALMTLIRDAEAAGKAPGGDGEETVIGTSMIEPDIEAILKWPWSNISSDGELDGKHPRGYGAFTRVLGVYVRERHVLTLEEAIRKMTTLAAANMGIKERGRISVGMYADLVLLDPGTVADRATLAEPHAVSSGIRTVWVNGVVVYESGRATGAYPGKIIKREAK